MAKAEEVMNFPSSEVNRCRPCSPGFDLMYANNDISVNDLIIKFDYRVKGKSKLNYKILYILLTFIFFRYLQRLMTKFKNY